MIQPKPIMLSEVDKARFWSKVARTGLNDCWEWQAARNRGGYGVFGCKSYTAHRIVYALCKGGTDLRVLHWCNNPACCNPRHLYAGTDSDNHCQCIVDGRAVDNRGEKNSCVKLTDSVVQEIRALSDDGWLQREIAEQFGISQSHVSEICSGKYWKHI